MASAKSSTLREAERIHAKALPGAKKDLVVRARSRMTITPKIEQRIMAAPTFAEAEAIVAIVEEAAGGARGVEDAALLAEGFDEQWIARYRARLRDDGEEAAAAMLATGRNARARAREQPAASRRTGAT